MSNSLQNLMDTIIMPMALPVLREACILPALVSTDFDEVAKAQHETIRVPLPQDMGLANDMDPSVGSSSTALTDNKVDITLDTWAYKQFSMNDQEMRTTVTAGVLPSAVDGSLKSLANRVNSDLWKLYKKVPYFSGTAGVTPVDAGALTDARLVLQRNLCPIPERYAAVTPETEASLLKEFKDAYKFGSTQALVEANLGRLMGFDVYSDQMAAVHTFGTFASGSPLVNGAVLAGAITMNIDGGSASETLKQGDVFTVAGAPGQYVVTADKTATTGAIAGVTFYPAAPVGGFADNSAVTIVKPTSGSSYAINFMFQRQAMMFAARSLSSEQSENSTISVASDPVTGIPLRLETWREPGKATRFWRFDILYGVQMLRPEMCSRMHG